MKELKQARQIYLDKAAGRRPAPIENLHQNVLHNAIHLSMPVRCTSEVAALTLAEVESLRPIKQNPLAS